MEAAALLSAATTCLDHRVLADIALTPDRVGARPRRYDTVPARYSRAGY